MINRYRWITHVCIGLLFVSIGPAALCAERGLSILLTNDDGFDSAGIIAVGDELRAAGHQVTVVAPSGQRSGSGMKISLGELALVEHQPGVWSVDASPADAVSIGLHHVMRDNPPDLVVSGANFGQNLGSNVMISGTVGAAMMAVLEGIPAVAISVGIDLEEARATPIRFPSTVQAFPAAARFTREIVSTLVSAGGEDGLLAHGVMLNINYPALAAPALKPAVWAKASRFGGFKLIYPDVAKASIRSSVAIDSRGLGDGNSDTAMFARGHITVSELRPDWNSQVTSTIALRLESLVSAAGAIDRSAEHPAQ